MLGRLVGPYRTPWCAVLGIPLPATIILVNGVEHHAPRCSRCVGTALSGEHRGARESAWLWGVMVLPLLMFSGDVQSHFASMVDSFAVAVNSAGSLRTASPRVGERVLSASRAVAAQRGHMP